MLLLSSSHSFCRWCLELLLVCQSCSHVTGRFCCPVCRRARGRGALISTCQGPCHSAEPEIERPGRAHPCKGKWPCAQGGVPQWRHGSFRGGGSRESLQSRMERAWREERRADTGAQERDL
ncbi:hypothetical protein HPG69_007905 [Diceros bicornis minor]|uniref:Uncharacterized protein n=1 Tax=Diceros bicornis minor TaxID=77932 RepID=A0A7J7EAU3_DICBM|nr:hypothetical protein HPG69_007905 [Diceros bicornis minor]